MRRKLKARPRTQYSRTRKPQRPGISNERRTSFVTRHPSFRGFTLTEVIIASALLVIAIVPILKALTNANLTSTIIEYRTQSLTLAQAKLEEIRASSIYDYSANYMETSTPLDGSYLCNVLDTYKGTNLREIEISVGYDTNNNGTLDTDEIEVTLITLIAKRW